jgi:NitT/TauT family transport system substrate-binding protein
MMTEVGKLIDTKDWALDQAAYDRTEQALLDQAIIKAKPTGAYTHDITDAAMK